ncbi:Bud-site selection protein [Fusarium flagelliforme]|uniref:Cellular morphogenesis protein n=1 Tax=Fusarium flagelliforme TaxID=2675880 RepID=A0A395MT98_9HYPO|nr:Bud-site selection protein [Fusarium flagelliforme]KAH7185864.1 Bud-site selection protein [Fusarium flagelliforme]RFN51178.1 cellular morphogenesis protein [Fusarium flagelliforme]
MPKRKRGEPNLGEKLEKHCNDVSKALKAAKGLERQRYSKRLHEDGVEPAKKERLEREVTVLKSLDLHQTARAHLYSSILKVKDLAASPNLPEEIRTGVPKPELTTDEQTALHNVTSGLYNRELVKQAITRAIATFCQALDVPLPGKAKRVRKSKKEEKEDQPSDRIEEDSKVEAKSDKEDVRASIEKEEEDEEESEWGGFSDNDEPAQEPEDIDSEDAANEEKSLSKYDHLLGGSSDSEDDEDFIKKYAQFKGKEQVNLDDISVSGSDAAPDLGSESESESDAQEEMSVSASPSPPPAKKKKAKAAAPATTKGSTFLPSLMGGYISGSESASDIDVAPPKKRLGQKQRQAIAEKKYGNKAKHLQKPAWETKRGRDSGWDGKRGAVGPDDGPRTPWKKGIRNPLSGGARVESKPEVNRPPPKKDDEGPLHPSWAARKQAKDAEKTAAFAGSKITFD